MFGCRIFTDQVPHSTRWRRTLNAAKPPETSYTTLPFSVMFLACWLCRSNAHAFVICYHVSWHSVQDGSSHPHSCVLKCYCALHVHECYWINQMNSYFNQQHPLETNQFWIASIKRWHIQFGQPRNTRHNTPTAYEISLPVTFQLTHVFRL